jgi:hypothetical protein
LWWGRSWSGEACPPAAPARARESRAEAELRYQALNVFQRHCLKRQRDAAQGACGKAIYETLHENGDLHSYILGPARRGSRLIVDELADIDRKAYQSNAVDVGPLRMYAEKSGVQFQFVAARLAGRTFQVSNERIVLHLQHTDIPLEPNLAGSHSPIMLLREGDSSCDNEEYCLRSNLCRKAVSRRQYR